MLEAECDPEAEVEVEGDASVSESVRASGVSSRMDNESGRVEGVMECHVDGDGLAILIAIVCGKGRRTGQRCLSFLELEVRF